MGPVEEGLLGDGSKTLKLAVCKCLRHTQKVWVKSWSKSGKIVGVVGLSSQLVRGRVTAFTYLTRGEHSTREARHRRTHIETVIWGNFISLEFHQSLQFAEEPIEPCASIQGHDDSKPNRELRRSTSQRKWESWESTHIQILLSKYLTIVPKNQKHPALAVVIIAMMK